MRVSVQSVPSGSLSLSWDWAGLSLVRLACFTSSERSSLNMQKRMQTLSDEGSVFLFKTPNMGEDEFSAAFLLKWQLWILKLNFMTFFQQFLTNERHFFSENNQSKCIFTFVVWCSHRPRRVPSVLLLFSTCLFLSFPHLFFRLGLEETVCEYYRDWDQTFILFFLHTSTHVLSVSF